MQAAKLDKITENTQTNPDTFVLLRTEHGSPIYGRLFESGWIDEVYHGDGTDIDGHHIHGVHGVASEASARRWLFKVEGWHGKVSRPSPSYMLVSAKDVERVYDPSDLTDDELEAMETETAELDAVEAENVRLTAALSDTETEIARVCPSAAHEPASRKDVTFFGNAQMQRRLETRQDLLALLVEAFELGATTG